MIRFEYGEHDPFFRRAIGAKWSSVDAESINPVSRLIFLGNVAYKLQWLALTDCTTIEKPLISLARSFHLSSQGAFSNVEAHVRISLVDFNRASDNSVKSVDKVTNWSP